MEKNFEKWQKKINYYFHFVFNSSFLAVILFIALITAMLPVQAASISDLENQLNSLRKRDKVLQQKAREYRVLVNNKNKEVRTFKSEINNLSGQIKSAEADIAYIKSSINLTTLEIERLDLAIEDILNNIDNKKTSTGDVLRNIYQADNITFLETFLSGNFENFFTNRQYLQSFQNRLNVFVDQLRILYNDLGQKKENKSYEISNLQELKSQQLIQQGILNSKRKYKRRLLSKSESEKQEFQSVLRGAEKQRQNLIRDILRIEEDVKRLRAFKLYVEAGKVPPPGTKIFVWPTESTYTTQGYGKTAFARSGRGGYFFHNGIDLGGGVGSKVYAAAEGKVVGRNNNECKNNVGSSLGDFSCQGGWGNWIAIKHPNNLVTLYTHLTNVSPGIKVGDRVEAKNLIGRIGSTGNVTGPHLHFSVYKEFFLVPKGYPGYNYNGTINPLQYL